MSETDAIRAAVLREQADEWDTCPLPMVPPRLVAEQLRARADLIVGAGQPSGRSCICPRFGDTGGFRIADLTCPTHGVEGTDPGDGYWDEAT